METYLVKHDLHRRQVAGVGTLYRVHRAGNTLRRGVVVPDLRMVESSERICFSSLYDLMIDANRMSFSSSLLMHVLVLTTRTAAM